MEKEDIPFLLQIHLVQSMDNLKQAFINFRRDILTTSIMGAMLSNLDLDSQRVKGRLWEVEK